MRKKLNIDHLTLGVCYYPEHWDKNMWRDDLKRMREMGVEVIRIAEFAWNKFEPYEGQFTFVFFDEFMDMTAEEGIKVIFCTPTATPPMWLCEKYPEILNADIDGNIIYPGTRRHCNLNSEKYREFSRRIAEKLAEHYSKYKNIVAWQIDNEINCECDMYYSESDHKAFRDYLKKRFGSLDKLNSEIGAEFWNQTYTDWSEVHLPRRTNAGAHSNPHMELLQRRFVSDTVISYIKLQTDAVRKYTCVPITTNGIFRHVDYHKLTDDVLDFITYDNYPNFAYSVDQDITRGNGLRDRNSSYNLTTIRSISPVFGIMEQQSGPSGWNFTMLQSSPKPGQVRLWTLQAIAHGADFVSYFRWRTCAFGTEIYWHGLHDYCNRPNRRTKEFEKTYKDIQKLQEICGKEYKAEAAVLQDYDNAWDAEEDLWHKRVGDISNDGWFCAFQKKHIPYDFVYINDETDLDELLKYKLVVYPHPTILTKMRAELLKEYIEQGGIVVFGCRTGYKNLNGSCSMMPMPGHAAELVGAEVEEFTFLSPHDKPEHIKLNGKLISAPCFNDVMEITDGECIGCFEGNYYSGKPAVSVKHIGKGRAYYFGAAFSEDAAREFIALSGICSPLDMEIPEGIELAIRGDYAFLLNYSDQPVEIPCDKIKELITGNEYNESLNISGYDAAVFRIN